MATIPVTKIFFQNSAFSMHLMYLWRNFLINPSAARDFVLKFLDNFAHTRAVGLVITIPKYLYCFQ